VSSLKANRIYSARSISDCNTLGFGNRFEIVPPLADPVDLTILMRMIVRINIKRSLFANPFNFVRKKGRLSLSINQDLLDRFEPYKQQVNFSAQTELMLARILEELENRAWAERNSEALLAHGRDVAATGLAGAEFDRI